MEEDSVEECLRGNSVVGPLVPEKTQDRAILAPKAGEQEQSTTAQDAPAANMQPPAVAMSSPDWVGTDPSQGASASASPFSLGTSDLPSPEPSQYLFTLRHRS